jgi:RNA polymerase sigma factor (sigma-70 family)
MSIAIAQHHITDRSAANPAFAELSDAEALHRFAAFGDADAFRLIAQRHASMVYATCLRVTGVPNLAEDASQETFFRLLSRSHEVNQNLAGWLHRTATHVALDVLRSESARRHRERRFARTSDRRESVPRADLDRHEASSWAELCPAVDAALAEMPEAPRLLLVEHYLLGKTQAQLATESKQSRATVCRRVQEALVDLRKRLRLKGISTMPALLAALLCQVHARQAPASVTKAIGKMAMLRGAMGRNAMQHGAMFHGAPRVCAAAFGRTSIGSPSFGAAMGRAAPRGALWLRVGLLLAITIGGVTVARCAAELLHVPPIISSPHSTDDAPQPSKFSILGCMWISHCNAIISADSK